MKVYKLRGVDEPVCWSCGRPLKEGWWNSWIDGGRRCTDCAFSDKPLDEEHVGKVAHRDLSRPAVKGHAGNFVPIAITKRNG